MGTENAVCNMKNRKLQNGSKHSVSTFEIINNELNKLHDPGNSISTRIFVENRCMVFSAKRV